MDEPGARGVSLWLAPEGEAGRRLGALIDRLAARLGTPAFPPHVTLLPGVELPDDEALEASRALARSLPPLSVRLEDVEGSREFFRCLVVRAAADAPLLAAHAAAARAFARPADPDFFPHLSLVYGSLEGSVQRALAAEVRPLVPAAFAAATLRVWRTAGRVARWREVAVLPLEAA
jgi:2'-5' RNA ligase